MIYNPPIFEDPAPRQRRRGGYRGTIYFRDTLRPLIEAPGRWARVASYDREATAVSTAARLTGDEIEIPQLERGRFQFMARNFYVYGRYLPQDDE